MKRSGRILLCLACGMALSAVAQAANGPTPASPKPDAADAAHPSDAAQKKLEFQKRIEELKKRIHAKNPGINISMPGGPAPGAGTSAPALNAAPPVHAPADNNMQGNPYASIVTRNVFGLNPPPPPMTDTPQGAPPPKITVTGITTIFGPREALYKVSGVPQGAGKPAKDESYILKEGEGQDDIVVQRIDMAKGMVTFNNHGVVQDIPLVAGVASGGAAAPSGGGGGFQAPRAAGLGGRPNIPNFNNLPANVRERLQQRFGNGAFNQNQNGNNFSPMGQYNNNNNNNGANPNTTGLSSQDNEALIAAQKAQLQAQGKPEWQIFPETPSFQQAQKEAGGGAPTP